MTLFMRATLKVRWKFVIMGSNVSGGKMYQYDEYDELPVKQRVVEFRDQVGRRLSGALTDAECLPLHLRNRLHMQKDADRLRVAIPYDVLLAGQVRMTVRIAPEYGRGYGHFTTCQNIQCNWISLEKAPDILEELEGVQMQVIPTSGNCVRNITT